MLDDSHRCGRANACLTLGERITVLHIRSIPRHLLLAGLSVLFVMIAARGEAQATSIAVNTTANELNSDGDCSLREAITAANWDSAVDGCLAGAGVDTIVLPAGTYDISGGVNSDGGDDNANAVGDLDIEGDLTIVGAGALDAVVTAHHDPYVERIFDILGTHQVSLSGMTITGGGGCCGYPGGGVRNATGIVAITDSIIRGNGFEYGEAGGIWNGSGITTITGSAVIANSGESVAGIDNVSGIVSVIDSAIMHNSSMSGGARGCCAIKNRGSFTISGSTVSENHSRGESTISNSGTMTITESDISRNSGSGSGIFNGGTLTVTGSAITENANVAADSGGDGGGVINVGLTTLVNTTVSGNTTDLDGGGIWNGSTGSMALTNVTVSGNRADHDGDFEPGSGGGLLNSAGGSITMRGTIVAGNADGTGENPDCAGILASEGHNLVQHVSAGCTIGGDVTGNITSKDAMLGPLANNSGQVRTHSLAPGSPAIDAGGPGCPPPNADARGVVRPQGKGCDIGAFELEKPAVARSCTGEDACDATGGKVGSNSCNGRYACRNSTGKIGDNACNGDFACDGSSGDVSKDSCTGWGSCLEATEGIGRKSCGGFMACAEAGAHIGDGSCNDREACFNARGGVGRLSCNAQQACSDSTALIGDHSCNGWTACRYNRGVIGDRSCNGSAACRNNERTVGRRECNGYRACDALAVR
jgi:CSLREA domain-containing protein